LIVVLVDESLALIELKQRNTGLTNLGVDFPGTDFPAVAEALGGVGRTVDSVAALEAEVPLAFARDTFTLLACPIGRKAYDGRI
nr:thiamine pyrophosphate-dependent enzyme [Alphaproteobacteria bacterium]